MALSDLAVFSEYAYSAMTETIAQQIHLFNGASRGAINLEYGAHQGDYSEEAFFAKIGGLVRRRNAYGTGTVAGKVLQNKVDRMVKVAAGTPPISLDPGQFKWIQQNPEVAGAAMGQQLAGDMLADMLNTGIGACYAALSQVAALKYDNTAQTTATLNAKACNDAAALFGDRSGDIVAWIVHSTPMHDYWDWAIDNKGILFKYDTINVMEDPFGRLFVVTDCPNLITTGTPNVYHSLGLVPGAIDVDQNNDFTDNYQTINGQENIARTYQAEWTYELGIYGFAWDKTNGGASPTDAAIMTATNWDQYSTSIKDTAGVVLETH